MIQICKKDKEKVFEAIRTGQIDAAELSFPNLIDDIVLTMKYQGLTDLLPLALSDKRRDNKHILFDILLCLAVTAKLKRKTSLTDVPVNACVVHDKKADKFFVFMTTDTSKTARQIINTYELRPEIEEDFRQMKDFWKLEDFKSTKYNYIAYHIVMTYIFISRYTRTWRKGKHIQGNPCRL